MERKVKLLNGTVDVALRLLAIMSTCRTKMSEDRISIYSYFAIHFSDLRSNETSAHPDIPFRNSGYMKSKEVIPDAINILMSRGLVDCDFSNKEITYYATETGCALYEQVEGEYKKLLVENIIKVHHSLQSMSDMQLSNIVSQNLQNWGSEFKYESILKDEVYE